MDKQSTTVLVIDDERFFREAIREILEAERLVCLESDDAEEALEIARDPSIGVVILDVRLPDVDGVDLLRRLREQRPTQQVIVLSASTDQELVLDALRLGACDYLAKPLHDEELVLSVRRAAASYGVASGWSGLQSRLERLADRVEVLAASLAGSEGEARAERIHQQAVAIAADVLEAGKTSIMLLCEDEASLRVAAVHGRELAAHEMDPVPVGEGVAGLAIEKIEAERVSDVGADPRFVGRPTDGRYDSPSFAIAPLAVGERRIGVLCATDRAGGRDFGAEDLCLLRLLAMQLSELLSQPEVMVEAEEPTLEYIEVETDEDDTSARDAELARLVCDAVVSEVEPQRVIEAALEPVARRLNAAPVSLFLVDAESGDLVLEGECDAGLRCDRSLLQRGVGLSGVVLETGQIVATDDPAADARFDAEMDTPDDGRAGPMLCVPLKLRGKTVGIFRAFPERGDGLSARTGEVLGAALSAAVRNVLLYRSLVESIEEVAAIRRQTQ